MTHLPAPVSEPAVLTRGLTYRQVQRIKRTQRRVRNVLTLIAFMTLAALVVIAMAF